MNVMAYRLLILKLWLLKQLMAAIKSLTGFAVILFIKVYQANRKAEKKRGDLSD